MLKETKKSVTRAEQDFAIDPSKYSDEELTTLGSSPLIKESTKKQIENEIEFREKLKTMGQVSNDVLNGGEGFVGINQYRNAIRRAVSKNDETAALQYAQNLAMFAARHQVKAVMAQSAITEGKGSEAYQAYSIAYGRNMNSQKLADTIAEEAELLALASEQARQEIDSLSKPVQAPQTQPKQEKVEPKQTPDVAENVAPESVETATSPSLTKINRAGKEATSKAVLSPKKMQEFKDSLGKLNDTQRQAVAQSIRDTLASLDSVGKPLISTETNKKRFKEALSLVEPKKETKAPVKQVKEKTTPKKEVKKKVEPKKETKPVQKRERS